ncbi:MAG: DNA-protecting protein DprA [Gammaproteobacteria bacterium]|nr:DNA-protecting protein DprA [Gammaproteobacteria bacterium]
MTPLAIFLSTRYTPSQKQALYEAPERFTANDEELARLEQHLEWQAKHTTHHIIELGSPHYPTALQQSATPPKFIFATGDPELLNLPTLSIVGSRKCTKEGYLTAKSWAQELATNGLVIASGLAEGIDSAAHDGALCAEGYTIAYMGTGANRIYPRRNHDLAKRIAEQGLLVTALPLDSEPRKHHFPQRNQLIATNTLGVLVVEASLRSGSLITAKLAADAGKSVFAIPGSRHNPVTEGCHHLIRQGAELVTQTGHILQSLLPHLPVDLSVIESSLHQDTKKAPPEVQNPITETILSNMGFEPISIDQLSVDTGLRAEEIASSMLLLSLEDQVQSLGGGRYQRIKK